MCSTTTPRGRSFRTTRNSSSVQGNLVVTGWPLAVTVFVFNLDKRDQTDFRRTIETHAMQIADTARDVNPAVIPAMQTFDKIHVAHGGKGCAEERQPHLPAVGVAAKNQIPQVRFKSRFLSGLCDRTMTVSSSPEIIPAKAVSG